MTDVHHAFVRFPSMAFLVDPNMKGHVGVAAQALTYFQRFDSANEYRRMCKGTWASRAQLHELWSVKVDCTCQMSSH